MPVPPRGGLPHGRGGPGYCWNDEEFGRWFPGLPGKGGPEPLLAECTLERMEAAGSGGTAELLSWFLVLAMTRGPADVLAYMPAIAWRSGTGMVAWNEIAQDPALAMDRGDGRHARAELRQGPLMLDRL